MNNAILHWSYRDFREFPEDLLEHSENVEEIYLKENFIPSIPEWLFEFRNLRFIHLGGNLLDHIPDGICLLENLEFLDVSRNKIRQLPDTISKLKQLKRLNVSDNKISVISRELNVDKFCDNPSLFIDIGSMYQLETIDFSKNSLTRIPIELAKCTLLNEILFNDNQLTEIPIKLITLPKLEVFEGDRCNLSYLPGIVSKMLTHVRLFNNTKLTHYPVIYERFLRLHYDYWSENVVSADQMMVFLPENSKTTILPKGMHIVHKPGYRTPMRLLELSLRSLYQNQDYYKIVCDCLKEDMVPRQIYIRIIYGPTTLCGNELCAVPLFTECYFLLLKKNKSSSHIIFSNMFCSTDCCDFWLNISKGKYHKINYAMFG